MFENALSQSFHFKPTERAQILLKNGTRDFQNSPPFERCFLVETSKIENTSFPLKTAMSEANVKTNRMETTK